MFIILLKFAENKSHASLYMDGHNAWLKQGFEDEVFLLAGGLTPDPGGGILAHNTTLSALKERVNNDPFVRQTVVTAEIIEMAPAKTDARLSFLMDEEQSQ